MEIRLDKVTRKLPLGFMKVYSLVVNDGALYVVRTGDVGGLQHSAENSPLDHTISSSVAERCAEELRRGEERVSNAPLKALINERGNSCVPISEIRYVDLRDGAMPEMRLKTDRGSFTFIFSDTPTDKVEAFKTVLTGKRY